jgi:acyl-CoA synthetase (AMP-forming)/AMP-acid ligase II/alcohol dehydrogenase class IV
MSSLPAASVFWGDRIAVEEIGGAPFRIYVERPKRISELFAFAERWGSRPYVVQGERVLTFAGLKTAVGAKSRALAEAGIKRGDRVFVLGWNGPAWVVNFWACVCAGAVPVAANAWWSEGELADALTALKPALTLADSRGAARMPTGWRIGSWEIELDATNTEAETNSDADAALPSKPSEPSENDPAVIIFTSGTEGRPKAVVLAHRSLLASLQMLLHISRRLPQQPKQGDETAGEAILHTGPLFHIGGVGAMLRGVTVGNTLVMPQGRFDPAEALALIERHQISRWNAVPTMATRLLEHPDVQQRDLSSLRALTLGGAPVSAELLKLMRSGLPGVEARIATGYGLSENGGQATAASGADTAGRPGSSGRPLPCVEIRIVPRSGMPDGEVFLRSPTQMLGYFGEDESPIDREGWLHTGDLGRLDDDGHLWITGRCKDIIIRGGENIAPAAVERALLAIPGVSEAAVFGVPHPDLGEEVMAVVVAEGETSPDRLQEHLSTSLASFAVPSRWSLRKEKLPVNMTGKIDKAALKAEAVAAGGSRVSDLSTAPVMPSFQHITPPLRIYQGADCLRFLKRELERLNSQRAVIVCGASLAREGALLDLARSAMGERCAGIFSGARAHSPAPAVAEAVQELRRLEADAVVAIGGGSAIVTARAASILLAEQGELASLSTAMDKDGTLRSPKLAAPKLPQLIIPTTPTTAMVKAGSAVLDPEAGERRALFDPKTRAQSIFIHPDFVRSAPRALVLGSALNSFALSVEGLTSLTGDPLADALLMHAVRLMTTHLASPALEGDAAGRGELVLAAVLCGQGTDFTGAGATTALGHIIGSRHHVENGIVNAIILPHALRFNAEVIQPGLAKVATALGLVSDGDTLLESVIAAIDRMCGALDVPRRLRDVGVPHDALPEIASLGMADWFVRGNPRPVRSVQELQQILEGAW